MAGRGGVAKGTWDGCVPRECRPDPRILRLNANLVWEEARCRHRHQWKRGSELYNRLLTRAYAALQDGGKIRAILWYQGETSPALPIVQVALASDVGRYFEVVREAQLGTELPNVVCVDAMGLEVKENDTLHLTTSAQVQLGKMLAIAFLRIGI
ncbi:Hypothetical predicted protein [Olea europaea subsp. europaea]|uniref:Sialate O-acetylesterase domain-containing protein n=1 Tax=Olea europaea subsp. europaea TaxID=158383 RepID=A0A8S0SFH1_OLEEU|nr:Hypothetical predicted protein [Olea europaea subsp. europaea]